MRRAVALMCLFPALTAGVRLQTGADSIPLAPLEKPALQATRLPAAAPLITPTLIFVQPTALPPLPAPSATTRISATHAISGTQVSASTPPVDLTLIPELNAQMCDKALTATSELALLSYQEEGTRPILKLAIAATAARAEVQGGHWPVLRAFESTRGAFPGNAPHRAEVMAAATAAHRLCTNPTPPQNGPTRGSSVFVPRPD